jgi:hypothetical protein
MGELQPILGSFNVTKLQAALFAKDKYIDHIRLVRLQIMYISYQQALNSGEEWSIYSG